MRNTMIVAGIALAGAASGQNLLNNASFEDALGFDFTDVSNWNGFFGGPEGVFLQAFNDTGAAARTGNNALVLTIQGGSTTPGFDSFTGHTQTVGGIVAGQEYELSMWARSNGAIENVAEYRIEWRDAGGNIIGDQFGLNTSYEAGLTSEYQRFALSAVAPAGAAQASAVFAVQSFANNGVLADISVAIDDAALVLVPSPASIAALGLGGLIATGRRRK